MSDHIHICVTIPPTISISSFIKYIKQGSSVAIKENRILDKWNGWQEGYGCFSYSLKELDNIVNYIKKQKEHHRKISFIEEYRKWLIDNGVSPDVTYFPK